MYAAAVLPSIISIFFDIVALPPNSYFRIDTPASLEDSSKQL
jgi:hypothetical protein